MGYVLKAVLSSAQHPEYGQITVPFPIPDEKYDRMIELLEPLEIGDALRQDCRVDELDSFYTVLNRLVGSLVNFDELDYLAKRLDSFDDGEAAQFQGMACKLGVSNIKDFINLTFCCQQATVITDFSDLDAIGRQHYMTMQGGGCRIEELERLDGRKFALDLILNHLEGRITPYGVVYDSRLLGIDSIDEYIRYGGTLRAGELAFDDEDVNAQDASFRDDESTRRYIDTAICKNIQHSLACYESGGHFRHLYSLYEAGELTSAINRIIEDMNHRFLISVLTDDFLSHDLRLTAANLRKERDPEKRTEALDAIDTEAVTQRLMELLDIRNMEEQSIGITTAHIIEIKQYLTALELIVDCPIESADPGIEPVEHILFTQPGMRYCQAQALIHSLLKDEQFSALSEYDKTQITGRILEEVRGRMMEDIVLLETMKAADKDHRVFKLQFEAGEFDMVIYDQKENSCEIFEIKHSSKQVPFQYRHLVDEDKCQRTERRFGPIHGRYILYRGEDAQMENGVQYWNVENYLKALPTLDIVQVQEIGMQSIEPTL